MEAVMTGTLIFSQELEVERRLAELGTSKGELVEICKKAAAARADATDDDPISGAGLLSWIYGTRALRATFRAKGWKRNSADNIPSVVNKETGIKLIFQNAECASDILRDPRSISDKKVATERLIQAAQLKLALFPEAEDPGEEFEPVGCTAYYLFVAVEDDLLSAELSCPRGIEKNQFSGFYERIFIINKGDVAPVVFDEDDEMGLGDDLDVVVTSR